MGSHLYRSIENRCSFPFVTFFLFFYIIGGSISNSRSICRITIPYLRKSRRNSHSSSKGRAAANIEGRPSLPSPYYPLYSYYGYSLRYFFSYSLLCPQPLSIAAPTFTTTVTTTPTTTTTTTVTFFPPALSQVGKRRHSLTPSTASVVCRVSK